jgi:hypothetical protein
MGFTPARELLPRGPSAPLPPLVRVAAKNARVRDRGVPELCPLPWVLLDRSCGRDRVELVRVVEHGGLGRPGRPRLVVDGDGVEQLGADLDLESRRALLDHP